MYIVRFPSWTFVSFVVKQKTERMKVENKNSPLLSCVCV